MIMFSKQKNKRIKDDIGENWKNKNKKYLKTIESFLDIASNIKDEELKNRMINNMLMCDKVLTDIAKDMFVECYNDGYRAGKRIN